MSSFNIYLITPLPVFEIKVPRRCDNQRNAYCLFIGPYGGKTAAKITRNVPRKKPDQLKIETIPMITSRTLLPTVNI